MFIPNVTPLELAKATVPVDVLFVPALIATPPPPPAGADAVMYPDELVPNVTLPPLLKAPMISTPVGARVTACTLFQSEGRTTDVYEMVIPSGTDQKRIEFNNIPIAFVSSFQVENQTGTTFASSGNSIIVQGL